MTELKNNLDSAKKPRVAFQGERGAFSEEAAVKLLGDAIDLGSAGPSAIVYSNARHGAGTLRLVAGCCSGGLRAALLVLNGLRRTPVGTGTSVRAPRSVRWTITSAT